MVCTICLCKVNSPKYIAMTSEKKPLRRAPRGVMSDKPLYTRLTSSERDEVLSVSNAERRSASSTVRSLLLLGLSVYKAKAAVRS